MKTWPAETVFLFRVGACMLPIVAGLLIAEGLALRAGMPVMARVWSKLAVILLCLMTLCLVAAVVCWICFCQTDTPVFH